MDPANQPTFGRWTGYAYTINSVVGAGFLGIPWAFQHGGWLLMLGFEVVFSAVSWLLSTQVLEIASRVEALQTHKDDTNYVHSISLWKLVRLGLTIDKVQEPLVALPPPDITHRQFDLSEVVRLLFGRW